MGKRSNDVMAVLGGRAAVPETPQHSGLVEGVIVSADATGAMFTIPTFDGGKFKFGPAPYPRTLMESAGVDPHIHAGTLPTAGARCLVAFVGSGIDRAWVLSWWV